MVSPAAWEAKSFGGFGGNTFDVMPARDLLQTSSTIPGLLAEVMAGKKNLALQKNITQLDRRQPDI